MNYYNNSNLDSLTEKVLQMLPPQRPFFESEQTIESYSKQLFFYKALPVYQERQKPFLELINKKIARLFNTQEQKRIQLPNQSQGLRAGIVDHHGVMNHPVLLGVNVVSNFSRMFDRTANGDIFTFATGNIPLNNYFYRRGFMVNGVHVNLYPKKDRNKIVYQYPLFDFDIVGSLQRTHQWKLHNKEAQQFLEKIQGIISNIDFSTCTTLGDQITKINFYLWPLLFGEDIRANVSNLVSLEYDDLISDFLVYLFENSPESFISQMLFNDELRNKTLIYFEGHTNAWNEARKMGTHFFWGLVNNEPVRLLLRSGVLANESGTICIPWNKNNIITALRNRQILPGMFLKYSTTIFYAGLKPFAGYASANSVATMQADLSQFLAPYFPEDVQYMKSLVVNNLTSVPVLLHRNSEKVIENYYAFDVMMHDGLSKKYFERINSVPIKYFMVPNLPAMYDYSFNLYGTGKKQTAQINSADSDTLLHNVL
jgi:hypothetical protein